MLRDAYPFYFIQRNSGTDNDVFREILLYRFKSSKSNLVYIVRVEVFEYNVYGIKFYLKNHSLSPNKYRLLTKTNEPRRIIYTCINIMLSIYESDPMASFGFVGANGMDEDCVCTKRYRFYSRIIATYISDSKFYHKENKDHSAYMLINRQGLAANPGLIEDIEGYFVSQYSDFD